MKEQENQQIFGSGNAGHFSESETLELKKSTAELKRPERKEKKMLALIICISPN
ncbi:MAG: hypothetical protein AB1668_05880 [Nanoarchaeota archaeon]